MIVSFLVMVCRSCVSVEVFVVFVECGDVCFCCIVCWELLLSSLCRINGMFFSSIVVSLIVVCVMVVFGILLSFLCCICFMCLKKFLCWVLGEGIVLVKMLCIGVIVSGFIFIVLFCGGSNGICKVIVLRFN